MYITRTVKGAGVAGLAPAARAQRVPRLCSSRALGIDARDAAHPDPSRRHPDRLVRAL